MMRSHDGEPEPRRHRSPPPPFPPPPPPDFGFRMPHTTPYGYDPPPPPFPPPHLRFQHRSASIATIERVPYTLRLGAPSVHSIIPTTVAIGPYHHGSPLLSGLEEAKSAAVAEFCRAVGQPREAVRGKILSVTEAARGSYAADRTLVSMDDGEFVDMMLMDGCFLLQFMTSMTRLRAGGSGGDDPDPGPDPVMSRPEVRRCINTILRDVMLLENQIPWLVLSSLMQLMSPPAAVPDVERFLSLIASAFLLDVSNDTNAAAADDRQTLQPGEPHGAGGHDDNDQPPPPHLLGLFYRRHMGSREVRRTQSQSPRVPVLAPLYSTAVELAEMGVKLAPSKTKTFGDMAMSKRRRHWPTLCLFGELSLAPLVLNNLTDRWFINVAAYELCQEGVDAAAADFPVCSYVALLSLLVNRKEDVQEMRAKGLVVSAFNDQQTLGFFNMLSMQINVGHRYYDVFRRLQEYKQERWLWIAVHSFLYNNARTIVTVLSVIGVLAGLFKTILSLKQPHG